MTRSLEDIRERVGPDNLCESCSRGGCRVSLAGAPRDRVIVDADRAFPAHGMKGPRCDFVLFLPSPGGGVLAAPVELKSGGVDASGAAAQLQGGSALVEHLTPAESAAVCRPTLFHGKRLHSSERKALNRAKIAFRGRALTIKTARCGARGNLKRALET